MTVTAQRSNTQCEEATGRLLTDFFACLCARQVLGHLCHVDGITAWAPLLADHATCSKHLGGGAYVRQGSQQAATV